MAVTLVDALDSLLVKQSAVPTVSSQHPDMSLTKQVMNSSSKLRDATHWLQDNLTFDLDQRVHVFEVTIRVLGTSGT